jgi:adenine deaminase
MNIDWQDTGDLRLPASGRRAKVIGLIPNQIVTDNLLEEVKIKDGLAVSDVERDILKIAVIERHLASGNVGLGFVRGFHLQRGALGSSVAHDSHNLMVVGTNDEDMLATAHEIERMRGGLAVVEGRRVLASLPLPIAGLMSDRPFEEVNEHLEAVLDAAHELGSPLHDPFMAMSFLALPVIPSLKITDKGLVDVTQFKLVPLFED